VFKVHIHHGKDKLKKLSSMKDKDVSPPHQPRVTFSHPSRLSSLAMGLFARSTRSAGKSRMRMRTIGWRRMGNVSLEPVTHILTYSP